MGISFVRWLHKVHADDVKRDRPYSVIYTLGPRIEMALGIDGEFDLPKLSEMIRSSYPEESADEFIKGLVFAEAAWRVDLAGLDSSTEIVATTAGLSTCTHMDLAGKPCTDPPVPGAARCAAHGGNILDPQTRRSVLLVAYSNMLNASDIAVSTLIDVMENSNSALARVYAAREILDRVGLVHQDGAHQGTDNTADEEQSDIIQSAIEKMNATRERLQLQAVPADELDEIEDAEIVSELEEADQPEESPPKKEAVEPVKPSAIPVTRDDIEVL